MYETDLSGEDFIILSDQPGFRVEKIEQQASHDLFFNEDGSGGKWTIEGVDPVFSEWIEVEPSEDGKSFHSLRSDEFEPTIPDFSGESYAAAEEYISGAEIPDTYMVLPAANKFRIAYETDLVEEVIIIAFYLLHGD